MAEWAICKVLRGGRLRSNTSINPCMERLVGWPLLPVPPRLAPHSPVTLHSLVCTLGPTGLPNAVWWALSPAASRATILAWAVLAKPFATHGRKLFAKETNQRKKRRITWGARLPWVRCRTTGPGRLHHVALGPDNLSSHHVPSSAPQSQYRHTFRINQMSTPKYFPMQNTFKAPADNLCFWCPGHTQYAQAIRHIELR